MDNETRQFDLNIERVLEHWTLPIEEDRKLPLLMTDDIQTGHISWKGRVVVNPFDVNGTLLHLERYPRLNAYFLAHEERIKNRHVARKNPHAWYRTIDKISEPLTYQPRLLIPDIKGASHERLASPMLR